MDPDDIQYRRSVRNMIVVLAAIVITVFSALFIPPYIHPYHEVFQASVSTTSPFGFIMHLELNSTSVSPGRGILLTGWINSTSSSFEDINASNSWAFSQAQLWGRICTSGWPIGLGLMQGHYTRDNYTLGTLIRIPQPLVYCPVQLSTPRDFLLRAHSSEALVTINGAPQVWNIQSSLAFNTRQDGNRLSPGVYTAVLGDEWGDVLTDNFFVT